MKAIVYHAWDDIRLDELPTPRIGAGELLLQVAGCGLCGSDLIKIQRHAPSPVVLGHELTGVIEAVGRDVTAFAPGQRVVVAHHVPCGECHYCRHGNETMCATHQTSNIDPCGFAEVIRVPAPHVRATTLLLPDALTHEEGSFTEPLACVVRAVRRSAFQPGDLAVVYGLGTMGLLMAQTLQAGGARVVGVDLLPDRLAFAATFGIEPLAADAPDHLDHLRALTDGRGADLALLTVGGAAAFAQALAGVRAGGMVHLFAATPGTFHDLDLNGVYHRELTILATYSSTPADLRTALDLLASRRVRVNQFISHRLPLDRFAEGVALFAERTARKVYYTIGEQ